MVGEKEEVPKTAEEWQEKIWTIWTDGPRLDDGRLGVVAVWWEEAHTPLPWTGANTGATYHPICRSAGWTGRRFPLGRNKEFFRPGAICAIQALKTFDNRNEQDRQSGFAWTR